MTMTVSETVTKDLYPVGEAPPLGVVPAEMHAWLVRADRFGEPMKGFQQEVVPVPTIGPDACILGR